DLIPLLFRHLEERPARLDAHVVVEDVHTAPAIECSLHHRLALCLARDICGEDSRLAPLLGDLLGCLLRALQRGIHAEDARALAAKEMAPRLAVPAPRPSRARAGEDGDFTL